MTAVDVHITHHETDVHVAITGEIDLTNRDLVAEQLISAISNHTTSITIDLGQVTYLDSTGLRLFFNLADRLRILQVQLTLAVSESSTSRQIIALSGLDQLVEISNASST